MKKVIAAAAGLMMVGVMASSASAVESKFGGYWRTRMYTSVDADGTDSGSKSFVDTRTRLYYTAIFNENFKFVNKFEMDATWGSDGRDYGDIGADGKSVEVKNSYADITLGPVNAKVGVFSNSLARNILLDGGTDTSGITAAINAGAVTVPLVWVKMGEEEAGMYEGDLYGVAPVIAAGEGITVQPYVVYIKIEGEETDTYFVGADFDVNMDAVSIWGTGIYSGGTYMDEDQAGFLLAGGATAGPVHGMVLFASGDDDATDDENSAFLATDLSSFYWAEILGKGTFDFSTAGPEDKLSNIWAVNFGFSVKPVDKLTIGGDVYYAELVEGDETEIGTEIDLTATYQVMDNLKLDLVAAYLIAGDAYGTEDPIEVGAQLSLSF